MSGIGDRLADKFQAKAAEGEDESRKALRQMTAELTAAVTGLDTFTKATAAAATAMHTTSQARTPTLPQASGTNSDIAALFAPTPEQRQSVQPQGTKDSK